MNIRRPTRSEIDAARAYVEDRVRICAFAEAECRELIQKAAMDIATVMSKYLRLGMTVRFSGSSACAKEINAIIERLLAEIRALCEEYYLPYDVVENEDEDTVNMLYSGVFVQEGHGATFSQRLDADGAMIAAVLHRNAAYWPELLHLDTDNDLKAATEVVEEAISMPSNRLALLTINSIALGWSNAAMFRAHRDGKTGFWVINGPNPCKFCASMAGPHPMDDPAPLYHPRCQCVTVFV